MCQRVTCSSCGKPGFVGCGRHVEAVLGDVPPAERCRCNESDEKTMPKPGTADPVTSWFRSLLGSKGGEVP
ncbi:MAG TPA: hypothetical protein VNN72_24825 [Polyangiaceae bacterium]|nr:hypothetical protein [Polyangiaceae bacterium]